ncbi:hypothetical protein ABZP36_021435 [Zizania latifolia]
MGHVVPTRPSRARARASPRGHALVRLGHGRLDVERFGSGLRVSLLNDSFALSPSPSPLFSVSFSLGIKKAAVFNLLPWRDSRAAGAEVFRRVSLRGSGVRRPSWGLVAPGGNCRVVSALLLKSPFFCLWDTTLSALVAVEDTMSVLDYR